VYGHLCVYSFIQKVCQFITNIKHDGVIIYKNHPMACTKYVKQTKNGIDSMINKSNRKKESKATQIGNNGNSEWEHFLFI
jgi:hypothetical protein